MYQKFITKFKIGIIVFLIILLVYTINVGLTYLENTYKLEASGIPMRCIIIATCGLMGNILLFYIIYLIVPIDFENIIQLFDARSIHKHEEVASKILPI